MAKVSFIGKIQKRGSRKSGERYAMEIIKEVVPQIKKDKLIGKQVKITIEDC